LPPDSSSLLWRSTFAVRCALRAHGIIRRGRSRRRPGHRDRRASGRRSFQVDDVVARLLTRTRCSVREGPLTTRRRQRVQNTVLLWTRGPEHRTPHVSMAVRARILDPSRPLGSLQRSARGACSCYIR
jgi:hypothetical protein